MKRKLALALVGAAGAVSLFVPLSVGADHNPVPAACIVVDSPPLHVQLGYTPHDPATDCTHLP